jgi:N-acetylmuramoyl-L-alanine amidase
MRRKISVLLLAAIFSMLLKASALAPKSPPQIYVDSEVVTLSVLPEVHDGTTYVPLRAMSEALGATVIIWDPLASTAQAESKGLTLSVTCGEQYIIANNRYIYMSGGCIIKENSIMVPIRLLALAFGAKVEWDGARNAIRLTSGKPIESGATFYDDTDVYWLSRIIYAEANGESFEGKIAVGNVVLNRVASGEFPNTVKGVIFDKKYGVQFTPAYSGAIYNTPTSECVIAAKLALEGTDIVGESLYFASVYAARSCWAARNRAFAAQIDNQVFFL